jgi:DNA-binding transcriptional regulator YhcF (GntR family)
MEAVRRRSLIQLTGTVAATTVHLVTQLVESQSSPFAVDREAELPVGVQLSWRLRALIASGHLKAGERLPSVRQLAEWAQVNLNTVRAVYAGLEGDGLISSRQGQGTFVKETVEPRPQLEAIATEALRRGREAGLDPRDLAVVMQACAAMPGIEEAEGAQTPPRPRKGPVELPDGETIEVRGELRRQIGRLETELAAYARDLPGHMPTAPLRAEAHVAGVEELEQTRDTLIAQLSEAQRAAEERVRREAEEKARRKAILEGQSGKAEGGPGPLDRAMSWWRAKR